MSLLIKIVGNGTRKLSELKENTIINLIFPLGNSFTVNVNNILLIGGGCGIAPLYYAAKYFKKRGVIINFLLGFRDKNNIILKEKFEELGNLYITTDNGSFGEKGTIMEHSILKNGCFDKILACGPEAMLKAIGKYSIERNIDCEISLENLMACGIGACLCCVTKTKDGNKCVCTHGPVFNVMEF